MLTNRDKTGWMCSLASHCQQMRVEHPDDELIVLFDVDGALESFLKAAVLLPTSLTADFGFPASSA